MALNDRYTKHLVVSDSATVNPSQMAENVILVNSAGQKISTKTDAELNSRFAQTVTHGSNAATARSGTGPLTWIGSVDPSNAADGDYLLRTDLQRFYARVSSAWMEMSPYQPATYKDSWYCTPVLITTSTIANVDGIVSFVPVWFPKGYTVTKLGVQVTSGGTSGSVMRFGIYDDVKGTPTNLIVDAGTVDTTGTGFKEVTLSLTIPTTGWYYLVVVPQGAAATPPTIRCGKPTNTFATHPTAANILDGNQWIAKYKTGVTAALPSLLDGIAAGAGNYAAAIAFAGTNP